MVFIYRVIEIQNSEKGRTKKHIGTNSVCSKSLNFQEKKYSDFLITFCTGFTNSGMKLMKYIIKELHIEF